MHGLRIILTLCKKKQEDKLELLDITGDGLTNTLDLILWVVFIYLAKKFWLQVIKQVL
jgi:hypothetical protein